MSELFQCNGGMMKLLICPICGKEVDGVGMLEFEVDGFSECPYCKRKIIPLETPQVCIH